MKIIAILVLIIVASSGLSAKIKNEGVIDDLVMSLSYDLDVFHPYNDEDEMRRFLMEKIDNLSLFYIITVHKSYLVYDSGFEYSVFCDSLIIADVIDEKTARVEINSWVFDFDRVIRRKILSYTSLFSIEDDGYRLLDVPSVVTLTANNKTERARFVYSNGNEERMFIADGYKINCTEDSPTARCETFNQLYNLFKKIQNFNPYNVHKILRSEYSGVLDDE